MASEAGTMAHSSTTAIPIIASSERGLDIISYCRYLFTQELDKFIAIFPCEFPQGNRASEEAFLRRFFSDDEILMQGGAEGEGNGFRFLKEAWLWAAHWNLKCRVPALAAWWIAQNDSILNDPDMKKRIFEPRVQPGTFFELKEISIYGDKLLRVVVKHIQYELQHPAPPLAHGTPPVVGDFDAILAEKTASTTSANQFSKRNTQQSTQQAVKSQRNTGETVTNYRRIEAVASQGHVQTQVQQGRPGLKGTTQWQHIGNACNIMAKSCGGQSARGSHGHKLHNSNVNRGAQAGSSPIYGRQDARYQSPLLPSAPYESHQGTMPTAGMLMQPGSISAASYTPGHTPPMRSCPQVSGHALPMQSINGVPTPYGYPIQGNLQAQFHNHMPDQPSFPSEYFPHHAQPFGDRSNFPNDGRNLDNESRLYNPDEMTKQPKQGSNNGSHLRNYKHRAQSYSQRSGKRGHHTFGQWGGNFGRDSRNSHRHAGSDFYGPAGYGQALNNQSFSIPPRERHWQAPYPADGNTVATQNYEQAPYMINSALPLTSNTGSGTAHDPDVSFIPSHHIRYPSTGHSSGHQRGLSKSTLCAPTECNKYNIGEECAYARKLVIFQVPLEMTVEAFKTFFRAFGAVENVCLSENHDDSQYYPGALHRRLSWVLFTRADSARAVLHRRGKPWDGGPVLFAEVAGEYWDPENKFYQLYRPTYGRSVPFKAASTLRAPNAIDNTMGQNDTPSDTNLMTPSQDNQKKKTSANNRKTRKHRKSVLEDEILDQESMGSASRQKLQPESAPTSNDTLRLHSDSLNSAAAKSVCKETIIMSTVKPATTLSNGIPATVGEEVDRTNGPKQAVETGRPKDAMNLETSHSMKSASSLATEDPIPSPSIVEELKVKSFTAVETLHPVDNNDEATKLSDEQADDSFHTAEGTHGEDTDAATFQKAVATPIECKAPCFPEECLELSEPAEDAEDIVDVNKSVEITMSPSIQPVLPVDGSTLNAESCEGMVKQGQSAATVEPSLVNAGATTTYPKRSVAIAKPSIDTNIMAVEENGDGDGAVHHAHSPTVSATSISGAPTSAFVTAPSTPAIAEPEMQLKSRKALKSKGPAQTESLSLFAKPKSRNSSSRKTKQSMESQIRPGSVSIIRPIDPAILYQLPHVTPYATVTAKKVATEPNAAKGSSSGASSESPQEPLISKTWSVTNLVGPVCALLSISSVPQDMKFDGHISSVNRQPHLCVEEENPMNQSAELENDILPKDLQDSHALSTVDLPASLGIFEPTAISGNATERTLSPGADESKPKKKKKKKTTKSKAKNKKSKATADVVIVGNALTHPKSSDPIYEFKGNDFASDSSSQTLGRTSPASKRPSLRQIDEAKQPKPLLEPRPPRQTRSKKYNSVHISKTDGAYSAEDVVVDSPPKRTIILTAWGDGTYLQGELEEKEGITLEQLALMPSVTPTSKSSPMPEKPWDTTEIVEGETPSPEAAKSKEKLRQLSDLEAAQKKKCA